MRYYSIKPPAETALTNIPKNVVDIPGRLKAGSKSIGVMIQSDWQPLTQTIPLNLSNSGWQPLTYTVTADSGAAVVPILLGATGQLSPTAETSVQLLIGSSSRPIGVYTGSLTLHASPGTTLGVPKTLPITLYVVQQVHQVYLPVLMVNAY